MLSRYVMHGNYLLEPINVRSVFACAHMSTWLTISFQSLMRVRVRPLLSVYPVKLNVAAAPHKSSSLSASLIVTSAWARLFRSYIREHTSVYAVIICGQQHLVDIFTETAVNQ